MSSSPARRSRLPADRRSSAPRSAGRWLVAAAFVAGSSLFATVDGDGHSKPLDEARQTAPSVRFALALAPAAAGPVYVLIARTDGQPGWVQVTRDGTPVHLRERCEVEDCGAQAAVCGMAIPEVRDLAALENRLIELTWDLTTSVIDPVSGCERRERVSPGAFAARFCFAPRAEVGGASAFPGMPGDRLVDPTCIERAFTLEDREVVLVIPVR
jgi:hypothetical protein